jgi:Regulator of chromosome condensation (RCC1) repeat
MSLIHHRRLPLHCSYVALLNDAYCCTHHLCMQGYGNGDSNYDPSNVTDVFLGADLTATAIAVGRSNTCAILSNKQLLCWGSNPYGTYTYIYAPL